MAITADKLKFAIRGVFLGQQVEVVQWYRPTGAAFLTADAASVAEAYWNDIKTLWRACHISGAFDHTTSIFVSEPGDSGAYGEFAVPTLEQPGTRDETGLGDFLPPTNSVAMRQTVATRATRPGQKRFWGLLEGDNVNGVLQAGMAALVEALSVKFDSTITLGSPVATGVLDPIIVSIDRATGDITASQLVIGHVLNPNVSTQNSRKFGHGA